MRNGNLVELELRCLGCEKVFLTTRTKRICKVCTNRNRRRMKEGRMLIPYKDAWFFTDFI